MRVARCFFGSAWMARRTARARSRRSSPAPGRSVRVSSMRSLAAGARQDLAAFVEALHWAAGGRFSGTLEAPDMVELNLMRSPDGKVLLAHLMNYHVELPAQRTRAMPTAASAAAPPSSAASAPSVRNASADAAQALPLRSAPRILRLWFKPWEDADRDLYDQGYVYVQVDGGLMDKFQLQRIK